MSVEIVDRNGWKYAKVTRPRGEGRALLKSLATKSDANAREQVKAAKLEEVSRADHADALLAEVWTRLIAGRNVRVRDAAAAFKEHRTVIGRALRSIESEQTVLDQFFRFTGDDFPNRPIAFVEAEHISNFINQPGDVKLPTRVWWLTLINGWINYCVEQRWLVKNPAVDVVVRLDGLTQEQLVSQPYVPFTEGEVKMLLALIPASDFWHGAVLFGYHFGLRMGAIATLEETNIVAHVLRVYTRKGQRVVHERLPDEIIEWLAVWRPLRPVSGLPYVFPFQAAAYLSDPAILSKQFKKILVDLGIHGKVFHGIRKTATEKRWSAELDELGDRDKRALMSMIAKNGFKKVQEMLAHAPGSSVTEKSYMPRHPAPA